MKRNITVNIYGSLYPMDEDAYALLNAYITNMREYFSRQTDGKEIADDIEGRVAELMSELRQNGTEAISIEHIEEIINRVGKPEQFAEEEEDESTTQAVPPIPSVNPKKKLFRDPEHKILGGVFGGFGCYLGVNPIWLRLAYLLILFGFFISMPRTIPIILLLICTYIVCWASIPLAANPADRLQMKGESVNISNMCDEFLSSTREMLSRQSEFNKNGRLTSGVINVLRLCVYAVGILLIAACIAGFIGLLIGIVSTLSAPWGSLRNFLGNHFPIMVIMDSNPSWLLWVSAISVILFLLISLYLLAHFTLRILGRVRPLSTTLKTISLIIWLITIVLSAGSLTKVVSNVVIEKQALYRRYHKKSRTESTFKIKEKQAEQLKASGWIIVRDYNIKNYTNSGKHYTGNGSLRYLDAALNNDEFGMEYEVEKILKVAPGTYKLKAYGRADGMGAEIFAINGSDTRFSEPIPVCGNKGGGIWKDARIQLNSDSALLLNNLHYLKKLANANDSQGFGWSEVVIDNVIVGPDSLVRYGLTNVSPTTSWDGTWLSATSFELIKKD